MAQGLRAVWPEPGSWSAQVRRESSHLRRMASRQTSFAGVETDGWSPLEGPAVHQVQTKDVLTT